MKNKLRDLSNTSFLLTFIPGFFILFGTLNVLTYNEINWLSLFILYLFVLANQLLENKFKSGYFPIKDRKRFPTIILEVISFFSILYFIFFHSILLGLILVCMVFFIQGQYLFTYYHLDYLILFILTLIKAVLINLIAFYLQTGFILTNNLLWTLPLIPPILIMEGLRMKCSIPEGFKKGCIIVSYVTGLILLYPSILGYIILLISIPFAAILWNEKELLFGYLFTFSFLFMYFLAVISTLIL